MRKLTLIEHISIDGIVQSPGHVDEDTENQFAHGGWCAPFADPLIAETIITAHGPALDLLLGRKTYDIWSKHWPHQEGKFADMFKRATKFVLTHRQNDLDWGPVSAFSGNVVAEIQNIKRSQGPDLICWGSSHLSPLLVANQLADKVILLTYPIVIGTGKRFFEKEAPTELKLESSQATAGGTLINTYSPIGPMRHQNAGE